MMSIWCCSAAAALGGRRLSLLAREGIEDSHYLAESEDIFEGPDKVTPNLNP
jgi:hypothetical protein